MLWMVIHFWEARREKLAEAGLVVIKYVCLFQSCFSKGTLGHLLPSISVSPACARG